MWDVLCFWWIWLLLWKLERWCCSIVASYYAHRGGVSVLGNDCGVFYTSCGSVSSDNKWYYGAALSFILHIILFMVVVLTLVMTVVHSMLLPTVVLLLSTGMLVLLYITSYYTCRGGNSGNNYDCGAFYVNDAVASGTNWRIGAALSFI